MVSDNSAFIALKWGIDCHRRPLRPQRQAFPLSRTQARVFFLPDSVPIKLIIRNIVYCIYGIIISWYSSSYRTLSYIRLHLAHGLGKSEKTYLYSLRLKHLLQILLIPLALSSDHVKHAISSMDKIAMCARLDNLFPVPCIPFKATVTSFLLSIFR